MPAKRDKAAYEIEATQDRVKITFNDAFWDDHVRNHQTGATYLDAYVEQVVQELRAVLYYLGTFDRPQH